MSELAVQLYTVREPLAADTVLIPAIVAAASQATPEVDLAATTSRVSDAIRDSQTYVSGLR